MNQAKIKQAVLKSMFNIYYKGVRKRYDWMGYQITEDNYPTYHHIVKREELVSNNKSSSATLDNGAYLGKRSHEMLHRIEQIDYDLYVCWNDLFKMINLMHVHPIDDVWNMIYQLREISENVLNQSNTNKKAK